MSDNAHESYIVEYRLAGLRFRITVDVPDGSKDTAIYEAGRAAERLIDNAAQIAKSGITVVRADAADTNDALSSPTSDWRHE